MQLSRTHRSSWPGRTRSWRDIRHAPRDDQGWLLLPFRLFAFCATALTLLCGTQAYALPAEAAAADITAFVAVTVVPMDSERVLRDQNVLVANGQIVALGHSLPVPKGARVVRGGYLSPGLADMHTHSDSREDLKVYLANGVTSMLNMGGASSGFMDRIRPDVNDGRIPGPHVYAGFMLDGSPQYNNFFVTAPEDARAVVRLAKQNGYDFIKVYNNLSPECFQALIEEGKLQHVPVIGHGVSAVGLKRQLEAGQVMVAHTEEFLYTVFYDPAHIPEEGAPSLTQIPGVIDFVARQKAFVTADLNTYATIARQWGKAGAGAAFLKMPEARYLGPRERIIWARESYATRPGSIDAKLAFLKRFTLALSDAGVPLIAGTDAPSIAGLVPGFSLHHDLSSLEEAGLSRYQVLASATRTAGEFIRRSLPDAEPFGTVTAGSRADLILSAGNPLEDLSTLRKPLGVMAKGKWYSATELQELLDSVATLYNSILTHPDAPRP
jgi:hypothetical protein